MLKKLFLLLVILIGTAVYAQPYVVSTEAKLEYNQGVDYYKIGQYERAAAAFRRAINIDPNYIDAYFNLGSILDYMGQSDAALSVFKQVIVRKPDDYESLYKAADISARLGQTDRAKIFLAGIPPTSTVYARAQELAASSLKTNMEIIRQQQAQAAAMANFASEDSAFNNIASPTGITSDGAGNVYVASFSDNVVYKITPESSKLMYLKDSRISGPIGMVSDASGNIYIANYSADNVLKVSPTGALSVAVSNVSKPYGVHISGKTLFITCQGSNSVVKHKL